VKSPFKILIEFERGGI